MTQTFKTGHPLAQGGFTLVELMIATAVTAILAATAYPSLQAPVFKARRSDGMAALLQLQLRQERWRSDHAEYASLAELKGAGTSSLGYYTLTITENGPAGFSATAAATGAQIGDKTCRLLHLRSQEGSMTLSSSSGEGKLNSSADNKRCWNQ